MPFITTGTYVGGGTDRWVSKPASTSMYLLLVLFMLHTRTYIHTAHTELVFRDGIESDFYPKKDLAC